MKINLVCSPSVSNKSLENTLLSFGHFVVVYSSGKDVKESIIEETAPHLWLISWQLEDMEGTELCNYLRTSETEPQAYLVLQLSHSPKNEDIQAAIASKADDILLEPYQAITLQMILKKAETIGEKRKKNLQQYARLYQSMKRTTLSDMALGICHEINNPLAILKGSAEKLQIFATEQPTDPDSLKRVSEVIDRSVERIKNTVKGMLLLGRQDDSSFTLFDLVQLTETVLLFLKTRYQSKEIQVKLNKPEFIVRALCRPDEISHVLLNLFLNSFEAISKLQVKWVEVNYHEAPTEWQISIKDSGKIDPQLEERIFDPYFTTKKQRSEMGLGLSVSHQIIQNHSGRLYLNKESQNTCFVFTLPKKSKHI